VFERESAPLERHGQEWIRTTEGVKPADLHLLKKFAKLDFFSILLGDYNVLIDLF
jgi:hypothetical protein